MNEPVYHLDSVVRARAETLEDFDGPLDVILLLLSKNKIEIQDVNITSILEQYLAWLDERKRMDMEVASEFIAMASHLMYIKTRMLLSKAEQEEAESDHGNSDPLPPRAPEQGGLRADQARRFAALRPQRNWTRPLYQRPGTLRARPDLPLPARPIRPADGPRRHCRPLGAPPAAACFQLRRHRRRGAVSRRQKAAEIVRRLFSHGVMRLKALFQGSRSRSEIVATFLALLELCKLKSVSIDDADDPSITYLKDPDEPVSAG